MVLHSEQVADLIDRQGRAIGRITVTHHESSRIFGKFAPGPDFSAVERLFQDFEEAVELQALSVVDELDREIAALGLGLRLPGKSQRAEVHDVQIWGDGEITFEMRDVTVAPIGGARSAAETPRTAKRPA